MLRPATAMDGGIMFSGCLFIHPMFVNTICQESLEGINSNLSKVKVTMRCEDSQEAFW